MAGFLASLLPGYSITGKLFSVVRRDGGSVRAEGKPGEGAVVFFTLRAEGDRE